MDETKARVFARLMFKTMAVAGALVVGLTWSGSVCGQWSAGTMISDGTGNSRDPRIAVRGAVVHAVWRSPSVDKIEYRRSLDGGTTWQAITTIANTATDGALNHPDIAVSGDDVHVIYVGHETETEEIRYVRSTDGGASFGSPVSIGSGSNRGHSPQVAASGAYVYVTWIHISPTYDVQFTRSTDGGGTWESVQNITTDDGTTEERSPGIAASGETVHLVWVEKTTFPNITVEYTRSTARGAATTWATATTLWTPSWDDDEVKVAAFGTNVYVDLQDAAPGPQQRKSINDGVTFAASVALGPGLGGNKPQVTASGTWSANGASVYSRSSNAYVATNTTAETLLGSNGTNTESDIAATTVDDLHVVVNNSFEVDYYRNLGPIGEISCEGMESMGGGTLRYQYAIRNTGDTPRVLDRFYLGTEDLNAANYLLWTAPPGFARVATVGTIPAVEAALGIPGELSVMYTSRRKTPHGTIPPVQSWASAGVIVWDVGSTVIPPGGVVRFGFDNPNLSWDVEWLSEHSDGVSVGQSDQPVAGPLGTFTDGWIHSPSDGVSAIYGPSDDTFLDQIAPNAVRGSLNYMASRNHLGATDGWEMDPLLKFELSSLAGGTITSATLYLYYYQWGDRDPVGRDLTSYRVTGTHVYPEYPSGDTPIPIQDNTTHTSTITVAEDKTVAKVTVKMNITHTHTADIEATLIGPEGTRVLLVADQGGSGDNFTDTVFDDDAGTPITSGSAPFTGSFQPQQPLADMIGVGSQGDWVLEIVDDYDGDTGSLDSWFLTLTYPAQPLWSELITSWNTRPTWVANPTSASTVPASFGWMSWDVTADVQAFAAGTAANHGWVILDEQDFGQVNIPYTLFRSKEYGNFVPYLEVNRTLSDCSQSPYPECLGQCPPGQYCEPDHDTGECICVVQCDQSPYPECDGGCPPNEVCVPDEETGSCECVPDGECVQCGPGAHFIDACGPFPPVGTDWVTASSVLAGIDLDFDCVEDVSLVLGPCPAPDHRLRVDKTLGPVDDSQNYPGTSPVDGHPTGPGLDVIDTEIVSMCLTSGGYTLVAGVDGPSSMSLRPSLGAVAEDETTPDPWWAESFFDVFFEVSGIPVGGPVYNRVPLRVESRIDCLPPAASYTHPERICIPLHTEGICDAGPNADSPCVYDLECPDSYCKDTIVLGNLVSANHSINEPVCDLSPFPECLGGCPAGRACVPDSMGSGTCLCVPIPCEQSPFAECLGECPPGEVCVPDSVTGVCVCEPAPCDQSPFPACGGDCPPGTDCVDTAQDGCQCEPIPCEQGPWPECQGECPPPEVCVDDAGPGCFCVVRACEQSPFPACEGDCPDGTVCVNDPATGECVCVSEGDACSQCGPGPHFVDDCGPFPPVGIDVPLFSGALVGIDTDLDCEADLSLVLDPCVLPDRLEVHKTVGPIDDSLNFPGTSPVDGHPTGPGLDVIDTEMVSLCLTDGAITLAAGTAGPSSLALLPSMGTVAEDLVTPDPSKAESFFDVFFEVSGVPGVGPLYNQVPLRVEGRIECLPPATSYSHPGHICLPLLTEGICSGGPNNGNPCAGDLNCPFGFCIQQTVFANLVAASHSVNEPVCVESPFPECEGGCPTGQVCVVDPQDGDNCICQPIACEQSPFGQCVGECPPNEVCLPDPTSGVCICEPLACEQSPFPECEVGACPPGEICVEDPGGSETCVCEPVACDQSPFPQCQGDCSPNQVCTPDPINDTCFCEPIPDFCEQRVFPECQGDCPPGQTCVPDSANEKCFCEPIPDFCELGPFPECQGECPPGEMCVSTTGECRCVPFCEEGPFPECEGGCPPGEGCVPDLQNGACICAPLPTPLCEETGFPVCDGACPPGQRCFPALPDNECFCWDCLVLDPGPIKDVEWPGPVKERMAWAPEPCSASYNVYRLITDRLWDFNGDGLANDYGRWWACLVPTPEVLDGENPPAGLLHYYLVTGNNALGEGSMGKASNGADRPNNDPCP